MRRKLFLAGPLTWPPLLGLVAGEALSESVAPARISDAAIEAADRCFAQLVPQEGARNEGVLVDVVEAESFERLCFFAAAAGAVPIPRHVFVDEERHAAVTFMRAAEAGGMRPGADWDAARWRARWGDVALAAAEEIMGCFGHIAEDDMAWRLPMVLARAQARVQAVRAPAPATLRSARPASAVRLESCDTSHAGYFLTRVCELRHPVFAGGLSASLRREVFVATDAAIVLPYDPVRDRVLLVEQFRMGPYGRGDPLPFVLEPVAGRVDAGESPEQTARRETREEAGLELDALEHVSSHYCSPGASTEFFHCYLGIADLPDDGRGAGGLDAEHEDIRTHVIPFARAMALMESGEINIGPLVLMLLWLERERPRLRERA